MPLFNKEKMLKGFGKAVDGVNGAADKAARYAKEKEVDKKIDNATEKVCDFFSDVGHSFKDTFGNKKEN